MNDSLVDDVNVTELYQVNLSELPSNGPAGAALQRLTEAWEALEDLEENLPNGGPDRWQADSLFAARDGVRRAWLAMSNLKRRLDRAEQA